MRITLKQFNNLLFFNYVILALLYAIANGWFFRPGSLITFIIPMVFIIYATWANIKYFKHFGETKIMLVFMAYFLILVFFSSDIQYSLKNVLKSFVPFLYFALAVTFVRDYKDLNKLFKAMMIVGFIYLANLLVANILNLGGGQYDEDEELYLQTGSIYSEGLNSMGYYLLMIPAIIKIYPFKNKKNQQLILLFAIIIFITLVLILKRGSLAIVLTGYVVILFVSGFSPKNNTLKIIIVTAVAMLLSYSVYKDILHSRIDVRSERISLDTHETEARYLENALVIDDIIYSGNIYWFLFGHDVLNSQGNYGGGVFGERQLHNDYAQILNGSGTIGLFMYLFLNISILLFYLKYKKRLIRNKLYGDNEKALNAMFMALFIAFFILSSSGSLGSMVYAVIRYLFLGAIIGVFLHKSKSIVQSAKNNGL